MIMGLRDIECWVQWFLYKLYVDLIIITFTTPLLGIKLMYNSELPIIWLFLLCYVVSGTIFVFFLTTVFKKGKYIYKLPCFFLIEIVVKCKPYYFLENQNGYNLKQCKQDWIFWENQVWFFVLIDEFYLIPGIYIYRK